MPPQAVTLEPVVQGECVVTTLRLPGRTGHAHRSWSVTFCLFEISAQGTGPLANISEKFLIHGYCITANPELLFKLRFRPFSYATLFK